MRTILAVGAHPDDIELGCGGSLIKHVCDGDTVIMCVITQGTHGPNATGRMDEQRHSCEIIGAILEWGDFPDGAVSQHEFKLVQYLESVLKKYQPDLAYIHGLDDTHQDHRAVALGCLGATRKLPRVLAFESPSAINFLPTAFTDISGTIDKKIESIHCHSSQVSGSMSVNPDAISGLAYYRGFQARTNAAEGFRTIRLLLLCNNEENPRHLDMGTGIFFCFIIVLLILVS